MSVELLQQISDNYLVACSLHRSLADVFWFIGMQGYAMLNEYQLSDESVEQRRVKRYITTTYHTFTPDKMPKSVNITEPLLKNKNRKLLKMEDSQHVISECFRIHCEWEESSLELYQHIAAQLGSKGEVSAFNFVGEIIKDVKEELVYVTDKIIELSAMNWEMSQIVAEQVDFAERYEYLVNNLGESKEHHHYNSSLDAKSRMSLLDN